MLLLLLEKMNLDFVIKSILKCIKNHLRKESIKFEIKKTFINESRSFNFRQCNVSIAHTAGKLKVFKVNRNSKEIV